MAFESLAERIDSLPLILAGPILRRVEPNSVTVWVALKQKSDVNLQVFRTRAKEGLPDQIDPSPVPLQPRAPTATIELGPHLHVVAVTAASNTPELSPGEIYAYNLLFGGAKNLLSGTDVLDAPGELNPAYTLSYFPHRLPTFAIPPSTLRHLRLAHGSCRKPHDKGRDGLAILDSLIDHGRDQPLGGKEEPGEPFKPGRPHQLFLTGDQIYAEEVKDSLLWLLMDAAKALLGWDEVLDDEEKTSIAQLMPGHRAKFLAHRAEFDTHAEGQRRSHLISLGEYFAMYLFAWSKTLWPPTLPTVEDVKKQVPGRTKAEREFVEALETKDGTKEWAKETRRLDEFRHDLPMVRRALANIPTYMIFDDHDVTDDWFINRFWTEHVLSQPLGKRVIQNALIAYALFQHWGNVPSDFAESGKPGRELINEVLKLKGTTNDRDKVRPAIDHFIGLPPPDSPGHPTLPAEMVADPIATASAPSAVLLRDEAKALRWDYVVTGHEYKHRVIVLDTRTRRGYPGPGDDKGPVAMLSPGALNEQLAARLRQDQPGEVTCVIAPTNPVGIRIIDLVQFLAYQAYLSDKLDAGITYLDIGDAWNFHEEAFSRLLTTMFNGGRKRVVLLSGDIHFGYAVRLSYWARKPYSPTGASVPYQEGVLAQLTSSAFKNADGPGFLTKILQTTAKPPESKQKWAGWNDLPELMKREFRTWWRAELPEKTPLVLRIDDDHIGDDEYGVGAAKYQPHWRYNVAFMRRRPMPGEKRVAVQLPPPPDPDEPDSWLRLFGNLMAPGLPAVANALWSSPWVQEGIEIVGLHNLGVISFAMPADETDPEPKEVIQDLYFWPSGPVTVPGSSRYRIELAVGKKPDDMEIHTP